MRRQTPLPYTLHLICTVITQYMTYSINIHVYLYRLWHCFQDIAPSSPTYLWQWNEKSVEEISLPSLLCSHSEPYCLLEVHSGYTAVQPLIGTLVISYRYIIVGEGGILATILFYKFGKLKCLPTCKNSVYLFRNTEQNSTYSNAIKNLPKGPSPIPRFVLSWHVLQEFLQEQSMGTGLVPFYSTR